MIVRDESLRPDRVTFLGRLNLSPPDGISRKERMEEFDMAQVHNVVGLELIVGLGLQIAVSRGILLQIQDWKHG
jgi:hypothetical protein